VFRFVIHEDRVTSIDVIADPKHLEAVSVTGGV
jgi:hypothetical protein